MSRIRCVLLGLVLFVGIGVFSVGGSAPAHAAASCGASSSLPTGIRVVHFNVLGGMHSSTWDSRKSTVALRMKRIYADDTQDRASIYGVTEVRADVEVKYLVSQLGNEYDSYATGASDQAIIYNTEVWARTGSQWNKTFSGAGTNSEYHGAVFVQLKHRATGKIVNVIETHLGLDATARQSQWNEIVSWTRSWSSPTIVLGDFNWASPGFEMTAEVAGFCSARTDAENTVSGTSAERYEPTLRSGSIIDYGLTKNKIYMTSYRVMDSRLNGVTGSDHNMITMQMKI